MKILLVLLAILKYTLFFVLFLLLLIIVLTLILMISPIRYTATVNYKKSDIYLHVNITYLSKIVGFNLKQKNGKLQIILRLFFKKINIYPDKKKRKTASKDVEDVSLKAVQKITPTDTLEDETKCRSSKDNNNEKYEKHLKNSTKNTKSNSAKVNSSDFLEKEEEHNESNAEDTNQNLILKINSIIKKINFYIDSYKTYPFRDKLFNKFRKIFHNLFDSIIPKYFEIAGLIYVSDPALTGQLLGALYALHGKCKRLSVSVDADFECEQNDITALISGRIIIFKLIQPVISFVWLGLKAEAKRRKITRIQLIKILINNE